MFFYPQKNPTLAREASAVRLWYAEQLQILPPGRAPETLDKAFRGSNYLFHSQLVHTTYDDYWKKRDLSLHMKNIHAAVMTVERMRSMWRTCQGRSEDVSCDRPIQSRSGRIRWWWGPWTHGGWARTDGDHLGDVTFNAKAVVVLPRADRVSVL